MKVNFQKKYFGAFYLFIIVLFTLNCSKKETKNSNKEQVNDVTEIVVSMEVSNYEVSMQRQGLLNLQKVDSSLMVDLKYSTSDNFFGEDVYGVLQNAYLQPKPANALKLANSILQVNNANLRLIIYDGARPLVVQKILWNKLDSLPPKKRKDFVADPNEGSIHNYGCAVDLSIFDTQTQQPLDMGTKYDHFGHLAYPRLENQMLKEGKLTNEQITNRQLLRKVMVSAGFEPITSEWWHFNYYSRKKAKELFKIVE